jgi:DNA-binding CsgD family transcriptional regulator
MAVGERRLDQMPDDRHPDAQDEFLVRFTLKGAACVVVPGNLTKSAGYLGCFELSGRCYTIIKAGEEKCSDLLDLLTPRELEIALLIASGQECKEIARRLRISFHTVRVHVGRIYSKLGLHKQTELAGLVSSRYGASHSTLRSLRGTAATVLAYLLSQTEWLHIMY